jgi:hypothetical protein
MFKEIGVHNQVYRCDSRAIVSCLLWDNYQLGWRRAADYTNCSVCSSTLVKTMVNNFPMFEIESACIIRSTRYAEQQRAITHNIMGWYINVVATCCKVKLAAEEASPATLINETMVNNFYVLKGVGAYTTKGLQVRHHNGNILLVDSLVSGQIWSIVKLRKRHLQRL